MNTKPARSRSPAMTPSCSSRTSRNTGLTGCGTPRSDSSAPIRALARRAVRGAPPHERDQAHLVGTPRRRASYLMEKGYHMVARQVGQST